MSTKIEPKGERRPERATPWRYAPAPESKDIVSIRDRYGLFIGGEFVEPKSGAYFETINPSNEETLAEVAEAGPEDVGLAVEAADLAFDKSWGHLPGKDRAKYLY